MKENITSESVKELLDYLGNRLFHIENYYHIYSELGLHYNKAVNIESAQAYLEVINSHKGFFMPLQESLRATLTVELCSFVVKKERKYKSIGKVIDQLKKLPDAPDLNGKYNQLLKRNANIISHLEKFRNQYYAHKTFADLFKLPPSSDKEFQDLFSEIKELLNEANSYFKSAVVFTDDAINDTHEVMNDLLEVTAGKKHAEYVSDLYQDGRENWHKD